MDTRAVASKSRRHSCQSEDGLDEYVTPLGTLRTTKYKLADLDGPCKYVRTMPPYLYGLLNCMWP